MVQKNKDIFSHTSSVLTNLQIVKKNNKNLRIYSIFVILIALVLLSNVSAQVTRISSRNSTFNGTTIFNGSIGIGLSNPSYKVHILHNNGDYGIVTTNGIIASGIFNGQPVSASENATFIGTANNFPLYLGTNTAMKFIKIDTSGNVGIGYNFEPNYPETKLYIFGGNGLKTIGAKSSTTLYLSGAGGSVGDIIQIGLGYNANPSSYTPTSIGQITTDASGATTSAALFFATRSDVTDTQPKERMRISGNGNVGIGTSNPGNKFVVNTTGDSVRYIGQYIISDFILSNFGYSQTVDSFNNSPTSFAIKTRTSSDYANRLTIDTNGFVGIGTNNPQTLLHLQKTSGYVAIRLSEDANKRGDYGWDVSNQRLYANTNGYSYPIYFDASNIILQSESNGNVGIGTNNPESILHLTKSVLGSVGPILHIDNTASSSIGNAAQIKFTNDLGGGLTTGGSLITSTMSSVVSSGASDLQLQTFNTNGVFNTGIIIKGTGNVGIGTINPESQLTVANSVYPAQNKSLVSILNGDDSTFVTNSALLYIKNAGNRGTKGYGSGSDLLKVEFSDSTALIINKDGNVGIGTINPGYPLTVNGTIYNTNGIVGSEIFNGKPVNINENASFIGTYTDHPLYLGVKDGTKYIKIDTSGNLGIGTASPSNKLDVNGSASVNGNLNISSANGCIKFASGGEICDSP